MQKNRSKWLVGLLVLATLLFGVAALAAPQTPKIIKADNPHQAQQIQARLNWFQQHPKLALARYHSQDAVNMMTAKLKGYLNPTSPAGKTAVKKVNENVLLAGAGYSEGDAHLIATNGNVTAWYSDTMLGNITFAAANNLAHPTAYGIGFYTDSVMYDSLQFVGNMLYANADTDIWVFDCTDPNNIQFVADIDMSCYVGTRDYITDFRVHGNYLYATLRQQGFIVYNLGNPSVPVLVANPFLNAGAVNTSIADLSDWRLYNLDVTDTTLILAGYNHNLGQYGSLQFNISDMTDPINTVVEYANSPIYPTDGGSNYFFDCYGIRYVSGQVFLLDSYANFGDPGNYTGVTRVCWPDETDGSTFNAGPCTGYLSIDDGIVGPATFVNDMAIYSTGSYVFTSFDNLGDDVAGEQWDWSSWTTPTTMVTFKTQRFFFNRYLNTAPTSSVYNYGGASIAFPPNMTTPATAYIAGYNYVAAFNSVGSMTDHYTVGDYPYFSWHISTTGEHHPPAGATLFNLLETTDDATTLVWYPEGISFVDNASGMRVGTWEVPNSADWVRNVAITSDNHYALVACGSLGLIVLDISNVSSPVTVGNWWTNPTAPTANRQPVTYVFINGRYAYVSTFVVASDAANPPATVDTNVVRVLDISNPPLPAEVASYAAPTATLNWDVNAMAIATTYAYNGHVYMMISNGQGHDNGAAYDPRNGNSLQQDATDGSLIIADVSDPSKLAGMFNVPLADSHGGSYARMAAFYVPSNSSNYWAYVAGGNIKPSIADGGVSIVDMGDPASGAVHTVEVGFMDDPFADKVYADNADNQLLIGYDWWFGGYGLDLYDVTLPTNPNWISGTLNTYLPFCRYMATLSDGTWVFTTFYANTDLFYMVNTPDYTAPSFSGGPNSDGWIQPYAPGTLSGPLTLTVQVVDNVAVTRVAFRAYFDSNSPFDGCYPGYVALGNGTSIGNNQWSLTIDPSQFWWTGDVYFQARAYDAGGNVAKSNTKFDWSVNAVPAVTVAVGPAGTDYPYVWSTTSISAQVQAPVADPNIQRVLFKVDGLSIGDGTFNPTTGLWYTNWNTTTFADGNHVVTAEATTTNGAVGVSAPVTKFVANNGPNSVKVTAPLSGSQVYGTAVNVSATVGDWPVPLDHVSFYLDRPANATSGGTLIGTATTGTPGSVKEGSTIFSITWDATQVADGNHTIVAVATDKRWDGTMRNGSSTWVSFSKVTPQPLAVSIVTSPSNPTDNTPVTAVATVTGGIAPYHYAWTVDGTAVGTDSPTFTQSMAVGSHTIALTVTDSTSTAANASVSVTVQASVSISGVTKASDPFRLKVYGSNFQSGAVVKINGTAVTTVFKSGSLLVAKQCKSLCPKGTAVQVTVTNPDGSTSAAFSFTR